LFSQGHSPTWNHFRDFVQIAFLDSQKVENEFEWPFDTFEKGFLDLT
jgi:hypothetical protein